MTTVVRRITGLCVFVVFVPIHVGAQEPPSRTVRAAAATLLGAGISQEEINSVATVLALQMATFPVGTSSGGFTYKFDPETGAFVLKSQDFGPLFAERASTLGEQGRFTVSLTSQSTRFESFERQNVRNGDLRSRIYLDGRPIEFDQFTLDFRTHTTSIAVNVAVEDRVDVGLILPVVHTSLSGAAASLDLATGQRRQRVVDVSATGLGDALLRGKWNFWNRGRGGLAAVLDIYVPTGSEDRLSTTGRFRFRPMFVASADVGTFSPHVNIGYTFGGSGVEVRPNEPFRPAIVRTDPGDELNYAIGGQVSVVPSLTLFADLVGRSLLSIARFDSGIPLVEVPGMGAFPAEALMPREGTLHTRLGAIGAKVTVFQSGLISAGLLFPLNDGGLRPGVTPVLGFEYTF
jgi:hypothetical protein